MARNPIQLYPGLSLPAFLAQYGTDAPCQASLFQYRWPNGFVCLDCGNTTGCRLSWDHYQCHRCHHQTLLIGGTIFHATHLTLTMWFLAIYLLTQRKSGISVLQLSRKLCVAYTTAWETQKQGFCVVGCGIRPLAEPGYDFHDEWGHDMEAPRFCHSAWAWKRPECSRANTWIPTCRSTARTSMSRPSEVASTPARSAARPAPAHDFADKTWRHLSFFQHHYYLHTRVPQAWRQAHRGVLARPGSDFTLLFEQGPCCSSRSCQYWPSTGSWRSPTGGYGTSCTTTWVGCWGSWTCRA